MARILGVPFNLISMPEVHRRVCAWRKEGTANFIMIANPHSVMLCQRDPELMRAAGLATLVLPDGVGIILAAKVLGYPEHGRIPGPSLMLYLCDKGREVGLRHFFFGGAEGIADRLSGELKKRFSGLEVVGTFCPPFRPLTTEEESQLRARLGETKPDVLWVGLGAPKQEKWIHRMLPDLCVPAVIGVGAAFDFHSGNMPWAPAWVRHAGFEWAYRLIVEPGRMFHRNLDSFAFIAGVVRQRMRGGHRG